MVYINLLDTTITIDASYVCVKESEGKNKQINDIQRESGHNHLLDAVCVCVCVSERETEREREMRLHFEG